MYRTLKGDEQGLVAYWKFEDGTDSSSSKLVFDGSPVLADRLVESGAPIASRERVKEHRERAVKIAKGRAEVEAVARKLPELNARIYRFANSLAGESFSSGDCWNFVNRAMEMAGAHRRDIYVFGEVVPLEKAIPGDLIQFEKFSSPSFGSDHHSAILWKNRGNGQITVIHQNAPPNGKGVGLWDIDVKQSTGTIVFFRPEGVR